MGSSLSVFVCYVTSKEIWYPFSFASSYLLSTELFACNRYLGTSRINWLLGKLYIAVVWPVILLSRARRTHALISTCILRRIEGYSKPNELYHRPRNPYTLKECICVTNRLFFSECGDDTITTLWYSLSMKSIFGKPS